MSSEPAATIRAADVLQLATDEQGRLHTDSKIGVAAVVGNEDGAHHISAVHLAHALRAMPYPPGE